MTLSKENQRWLEGIATESFKAVTGKTDQIKSEKSDTGGRYCRCETPNNLGLEEKLWLEIWLCRFAKQNKLSLYYGFSMPKKTYKRIFKKVGHDLPEIKDNDLEERRKGLKTLNQKRARDFDFKLCYFEKYDSAETYWFGAYIQDPLTRNKSALRVKIIKFYRKFLDDKTFFERSINPQNNFNPKNLEDARKKIEASIVCRQGQSDFRNMLLKIYDNHCAMSGCNAEKALEGAHIVPYRGQHTNHPSNGIFLRADLHTLFDLGLLSINPDTYKIECSSELSNSNSH